MQPSPHTGHVVHHVRLDAAGRVVIPAELRRRWNVDKGDTLLLTEDASGVRLQTMDEVIRQIQEHFSQLIPPGVSLVDELLADRRAEAARD